MLGAITIDVDTLPSLFKIIDRKNYDYNDFSKGLDNFSKLLDKNKIKATFFVVGKDLENKNNKKIIKKLSLKGHEIANHSYSHIQGFAHLSYKKKIEEIKAAEDLIFDITKEKPVGFRSPGWNLNEEVLDILNKRGYKYDSSIMPSYFNFIFKILNYVNTKNETLYNRTTMGPLKYSISKTEPHKIRKNLIEIPITVSYPFRIPYFGTIVHKFGTKFFDKNIKTNINNSNLINFEFHLVEFLSKDQMINKIPKRGYYIPPTINKELKDKQKISEHILTKMSKKCGMITLNKFSEDFNK